MLRLIQSISFVLIMAGFEQLAYYQPKSDSKETISPAQKQDSSPDDSFDIVREAKKRDFTKDLLKFSENEQQIEGFEEYQGILSKEEIQGLIGKSERNRYTLLASLNDQIVGTDSLSPEEVKQITELKQILGNTWDIVKDILIPEWYELPLLALPVSQEVIIGEKLTRIALIVEKMIPEIERVKKIGNFGESGLKAIDNALELAKQGNLTKLKEIIRLLIRSKNPEKIQVATELAKVKKEVQLIKIEGREVEKGYEAMDKLVDTNLNRLFARGKPRYSEVREDILSEIKNFEKRNNVKHDPKELKRYMVELSELLESHNVDIKNLKTLKDMKNYLLHNH